MRKIILSLLLVASACFAQTEDIKITAADGTVINTKTVKFGTGKLMVNGVAVVGGGITSVTGTAPIVSSGGTTPAISIVAATGSVPGSMSAADKTKLDGIAAGAQPGTVTSVAVSGANGIGVTGSPITTSGTISLSLGAITPTSVNGNTVTTGTGTLTLGSVTLNAGVGGTLGTAAFTASGAYQPIDSDLTSWATVTRGTGFDTFTATPTIANFNTLLSDADVPPTTRSISTTSPLSGGGDLSANRTLAIADAAADGSTKGASTFTAADFNATSGVIAIDYTNGQSATGSVKGFLTSADWTTFNNKLSLSSLSANVQTLLQAEDYATFRSDLGLVIGTNVQAFDADLTTWAGITPGTGVGTFLATPTSANLAAAITNETGTGLLVFNNAPVFDTSFSLSGGAGAYFFQISNSGFGSDWMVLTGDPGLSTAKSALQTSPSQGTYINGPTGTLLGFRIANVDKGRLFSSGGWYFGDTPVDPAANNAQVQGTIIAKHFKGSSTAPTIANGAGAGTSPGTPTLTGTDAAGKITIITGTLPTVSAVAVTVTFNGAYGTAPYVVIWPANAAAATLGFLPWVASTTTTFTVNTGTIALGGSTTYSYNFVVVE